MSGLAALLATASPASTDGTEPSVADVRTPWSTPAGASRYVDGWHDGTKDEFLDRGRRGAGVAGRTTAATSTRWPTACTTSAPTATARSCCGTAGDRSARNAEQAFSVALSVLGTRVNAERGGLVRGAAARRRPRAWPASPASTEQPRRPLGDRGRERRAARPRASRSRAPRRAAVECAGRRAASITASTCACAPEASMMPRSRATRPASSGVPSERSSRPRPPGPAASRASATSTVRLPSTRSSPAGLPVVAGSPKTPSRSSRSWNASPSGRPNAVSAASVARRRPASAAPMCSGRSMEYFADL